MSVEVIDAFGASTDPAMPSLKFAMDPGEAQEEFGRRLTRLTGDRGEINLRSIRVARYKPGRRCLVEYDLDVTRPDGSIEAAPLLGKVRVHRFGKSGYRLLNALWEAGFSSGEQDGISVPEPIGTVSRFRMWLQRKVPGRPSTELLGGPGGRELAMRIAQAAHKLHRSGVRPERRHTIADELQILHDKLPMVADLEPDWSNRIERLLRACDRLAAALPTPQPRPIHRDFYADQVIVDGRRLYVVDFDLYCEGDPGLDIGNFVGHVTEQSLRTLGSHEALVDVEEALEEHFVRLAGEETRASVRGYAALTLARHVYLSTRFPERRPFTASLLELSEERLDALVRGNGALR